MTGKRGDDFKVSFYIIGCKNSRKMEVGVEAYFCVFQNPHIHTKQ